MTALETAALYYDAWQNKHGDFSEVPLADDFEFSGPVASFDSAEGYRAQRVLIGDSTPDPGSTVAEIDPGIVATFEKAFTTSRLLAFNYVDREGRRTRRRVEPHGLLVRAPLWYVIAWDPRRDAPRLFRADRIRRPSITEQTFLPRPDELVTRICPDARATASAAPREPVRATPPPSD